MTVTKKPEKIMWEGTMRRLSLKDQIRTTAMGGYDTLSITPLQYSRLLASGVSTEDILGLATDAGVRISHLDPLCTWCRHWRPENIEDVAKAGEWHGLATSELAFFSFSVGDFLRMARALKVESITVMSVAPPNKMSVEELTEDFAKLCDQAADQGLRCDLEFIPLDWAIPDLAMAWQILRDADRKNSGLVIDTWHFMRSGSSLDLLKTIPGEKISQVQIADGVREVPAHRSKFQDCLEDRLPPGKGALPITAILKVLKDINGIHRIGPEIFSSVLDTMTPEGIANICRDSLSEALKAAQIQI